MIIDAHPANTDSQKTNPPSALSSPSCQRRHRNGTIACPASSGLAPYYRQ
jgi:hypothetical protein